MNINYKYISALLILGLVFSSTLRGQDYQEEVTVDLSESSKSGTLDIRNHDGTITIEGYSGNQVIVQVFSPEEKKPNDGRKGKNGLKRISMNAVDVEIYEEDNYVNVDGGKKRTDFIIKVPQKFDLKVHAHHNGTVKVSNISGQMEIISHHGSIRLKDVAGSLVADTHHGEIKANFLSINDNPMAFSTYHGDVDITFPEGVSFDAKIKSEKGDIYTDFDVSMNAVNKETKSSRSGKKQIKIGGWMTGQFGSGGKEYLFNTYHGDIVIQKL
ncbi:MAG: DUF4097 and DUF4098 domain-containing protein YvlB [Saprospiraceae bacterium]|jgi:DUF4097 and DUF4098 domain-containing protein YvlB